VAVTPAVLVAAVVAVSTAVAVAAASMVAAVPATVVAADTGKSLNLFNKRPVCFGSRAFCIPHSAPAEVHLPANSNFRVCSPNGKLQT
jgi:hypothetical protein